MNCPRCGLSGYDEPGNGHLCFHPITGKQYADQVNEDLQRIFPAKPSPESPAQEQPGERNAGGVPLSEVTNEMCQAGIDAWNGTFGSPYTRYAAIFRAMLNAAPQAGQSNLGRAFGNEGHAAGPAVAAQPGEQNAVNWTTEGCPKHHGQSWIMGMTPVHTVIAKRCPICEGRTAMDQPPPPERP